MPDYRILNGILNPRVQCVPLRADEQPELRYMRIRHKHFAFDINSMALLEVGSIKDFAELRANPPSPYIMAKYKPSFQPSPQPEKLGHMVLNVTHDCNLACSYCFVRNFYADHGTGNYMTFPTAKTAIDRLMDANQRLSIGFFGGEPLLNFALVKEVVEYAEKLAVERGPVCKTCGGAGRVRGERCSVCRGLGKQAPSFGVTTNGILSTEEILAFLEDHGFSMITSIDGDADAHDALRPMKRSGRGSHAQIVAGLRRVAKTGLARRNTLRSTFTAMEGQTIASRLEFLNQLCDDGCGSHVSVEPAALSENSCFYPNQDTLEVHVGNIWNRFHDEYLEAADWWVNRVRAGKKARFHNVHKSIERIFHCLHAGSECGAGKGYGAVNAKGEVFGCHRESNSYLGTLQTGIDPKLRAPWLDNRLYSRSACNTCGHRYVCGGGCREDSLGDRGVIHDPSNVHCALKQCWVEAAIWIMSELNKHELLESVPDPRPNARPSPQLLSFIPPEAVPRDEHGIAQPRWIGNIPQVALVKEGAKDRVFDLPVADAPADKYAIFDQCVSDY